MNHASANPLFTGTRRYRLSAEDYLRMMETDVFGDAHVELVEGELVEMAPAGIDHGASNARVVADLVAACGPLGYVVACDVVIELTDETVRAPDISVVDCDTGSRQKLVPSDVLLAVEISHSTLAVDLGRKRIDYAAAGIRHYWVVDLAGRRVHCYDDPQGCDYAAIRVVGFGDPVPVPGTDRTITLT